MEGVEALVVELEEALARPLLLPHQASSIAMGLYRLSIVHRLDRDPRVVELGQKFDEAMKRARLPDILTNQLDYASRLASAPGELIYEEMYKLLSLCDEIHALRSLGFHAEDAALRRFELDVRRRFAAQPRAAVLAAEDAVEDWSRALWWYAENLARPAQES